VGCIFDDNVINLLI